MCFFYFSGNCLLFILAVIFVLLHSCMYYMNVFFYSRDCMYVLKDMPLG
uniref:Uncharacterized protein n=1 Tax=Rhizophora mucronata TaxID=61149 RepID=A0A2P2P452_RHIMU